MKNYDLYFFDFDNTLTMFPLNIDYMSIRNELCNVVAKNGKNAAEKNDKFVPIVDTIYEYEEKYEGFKNVAFGIIDKYEAQSIENVICDKIIVDIYNKLPKEKKIIVTRNGELCLKMFLDKYNLEYPYIVCSRDNIRNLKPDIESYTYVSKIICNLDEKNILMIGDSIHDEHFARNCKIDYKNKISFY